VAGRSVGDVMGVAKEQKELIRRNQASSWTWTSCVHQADTGREESQSHKIRMPCLVCLPSRSSWRDIAANYLASSVIHVPWDMLAMGYWDMMHVVVDDIASSAQCSPDGWIERPMQNQELRTSWCDATEL